MALEHHLLPQKFIIDNYINILLNSIVITVVITLIVIYASN